MNDQPTVEQSLHSIALSMISIHKELRDTRRIHNDTLRVRRFPKQTIIRPAPRKPTVWGWLKGLLPA